MSINASSFLANVMPPIRAASKTKDTSSKGKINLVSNISPKSSVDEPEVIVTSPPKPFIKIYENRRNELCDGLNRIGWDVTKPLATMFVWAKIPKKFNDLGSLEFSKLLIKHAKVAVSPGAGFGEDGDDYVRFSLIENEHRTRQAVRGIRNFFNGK